MAIFDSNNASERAAFSKRDPRDERIRAQAKTVTPAALDTAGETLALLALLPEAFIRSQKRELTRMMRTEKDEMSPRIAALKRSIEDAGDLGQTARLGLARIERLSTTLEKDAQVFQGFVSDAELQPIAGARVQLSASQATEGKVLSAVTATDGYFSIPLEGGKPTRDTPMAGGLTDMINRAFGAAEKVDAKNAKVKAEAAAAAAASGSAQQRMGRVEIFDAVGKSLHVDPQPLPLGERGIYREYVIGGSKDGKPGKGSGFGRATGSPEPAATEVSANKPVSSDPGTRTTGATAAATKSTRRGAAKTAENETPGQMPDRKAGDTQASKPEASKTGTPTSTKGGKTP